MSPFHSLSAIWLASCTAAAAFHRRGSANDTAPYTNVTLSTSPTSVASTVSLPVASTSSSTAVSTEHVVVVSSSEHVDARPTLAEPSQSPELTVQANATSTVSNSTTNSTVDSTVPELTTNSTVSSLDAGNNATSSEPTQVSNASCTINIPSASIDYWYPATYKYAVATITSIAGNFSHSRSYTLVSATTEFDVARALESDFACTNSYSTVDPTWTNTWCVDYFDKPTAAATALAYRTGYAPFPTGGVIAISDVMDYDIFENLPLATHTISVAPNRTLEQVSATPYVHFTAYEIASGNRTETVQLSSAFAYPYEGDDVQHAVSATGTLPKEFVQQVSRPDCAAGQLMATVTVVIVVDLYYENNPFLDPLGVRIEQTALGFDEPVNVNNEDGDGRGTPITMGDWDLPGDSPKATPGPSVTNNGANPTTRAGSNTNNNNNPQQGQVPNLAQPTAVTVGNIGTAPVVVKPSSVVVVGSQTLQPGGPAVVVGGVTPVSLVPAATAIVVGGSTTLQLPQVSNDPIPPPVLTIGSSTLTPNAATQFFIAPGQTLTPGGTATIDGTLVSLAPSASFVVVGGSTQLLPAAAPDTGPFTRPPQIVVGGATFTALPAQGNPVNNQNNVQNNAASGPTFVIDGQTLAPGGQAITAGGNTISLVPGGSSVVVNGVTSAVVNPASQISRPRIVVGNDVFTAGPGGNSFVIGDQTLSAGGPAITVSGTVVSLAPSASFVVINGVTSALANAAAARMTDAPAMTIGNEVIRPLPGSGLSYVIGSSTLTPGGVITVSGTTISLAAGATAIVINGKTTFLTPSAQATITNAPLLTIGSSTITAISGTTYIIGGQTLTPGGTITVDGTTIVLAPGATQLIYGSSGRSTTTALFPATTTRSQNISGASSATAQAIGTNGQPAATSRPTGSASVSRIDSSLLSLIFALLGLSLC